MHRLRQIVLQFIAFALVLSVPALPATKNRTFDGIWVLNTAKTDCATFEAPRQVVLRVEQQGDGWRVIEVAKGKNGVAVAQSAYLLDVSGHPFKRFLALRSGVRSEQWMLSAHGSKLVIQRVADSCDRSVRLFFKRSSAVPTR